MKQIRIQGNNLLTGKISIGGAKNSAVALVPASLLSDDVVTIDVFDFETNFPILWARSE